MAVNPGLKTLLTASCQSLVDDMKAIETGPLTTKQKMGKVAIIGVNLKQLSDLYNSLENVDVKLGVT